MAGGVRFSSPQWHSHCSYVEKRPHAEAYARLVPQHIALQLTDRFYFVVTGDKGIRDDHGLLKALFRADHSRERQAD